MADAAPVPVPRAPPRPRASGGQLPRPGSIFFDVETRDIKHTLVETGLLAALVKGTRFSMDYDEETAALRVEHGIVEAVDLVRMERVDVRDKQSVEVSRTNPEQMTVRGPGHQAERQASGRQNGRPSVRWNRRLKATTAPRRRRRT